MPHGARGAITRPRPPAEAPDPGLDSPPPKHLEAVSISPPGESGFFSLAGQRAYEAPGEPSAFGPHVDDQRLLYWTFGYTPAGFAQPTGEPERPTPGARLYRDAYGVPVVYGGSPRDVWFAVG